MYCMFKVDQLSLRFQIIFFTRLRKSFPLIKVGNCVTWRTKTFVEDDRFPGFQTLDELRFVSRNRNVGLDLEYRDNEDSRNSNTYNEIAVDLFLN